MPRRRILLREEATLKIADIHGLALNSKMKTASQRRHWSQRPAEMRIYRDRARFLSLLAFVAAATSACAYQRAQLNTWRHASDTRSLRASTKNRQRAPEQNQNDRREC